MNQLEQDDPNLHKRKKINEKVYKPIKYSWDLHHQHAFCISIEQCADLVIIHRFVCFFFLFMTTITAIQTKICLY